MTVTDIILSLFFFGLAAAFVAIAALARQIGILFDRVAPAGALSLSAGPKLGEPAPVFKLAALGGATVEIGGTRADGRAQMILFVGPECPICRELIPAARSLASSEKGWLDIVYASDGGSIDDHMSHAREQRLDINAYLLSRDLGLGYHVAKVPFAVLIDGNGALSSRGLVNSREHLESLIEAKRLGV
ncbi:MAG: hypothetical protein ACREB0_03135, partial [Sphingopyxis sp.]